MCLDLLESLVLVVLCRLDRSLMGSTVWATSSLATTASFSARLVAWRTLSFDELDILDVHRRRVRVRTLYIYIERILVVELS